MQRQKRLKSRSSSKQLQIQVLRSLSVGLLLEKWHSTSVSVTSMSASKSALFLLIFFIKMIIYVFMSIYENGCMP